MKSKYLIRAQYTRSYATEYALSSPIDVAFGPEENAQMTMIFSTWAVDRDRFDRVALIVYDTDGGFVEIANSGVIRQQQDAQQDAQRTADRNRAEQEARQRPSDGFRHSGSEPQSFGKKPPFVK